MTVWHLQYKIVKWLTRRNVAGGINPVIPTGFWFILIIMMNKLIIIITSSNNYKGAAAGGTWGTTTQYMHTTSFSILGNTAFKNAILNRVELCMTKLHYVWWNESEPAAAAAAVVSISECTILSESTEPWILFMLLLIIINVHLSYLSSLTNSSWNASELFLLSNTSSSSSYMAGCS